MVVDTESVGCDWAHLQVLDAMVMALTPYGAQVGHTCGSRIGIRKRASPLRCCETEQLVISKSNFASCQRFT